LHHARQEWSGQFGFILSAIGSAVGLGNIWRFPGVVYENGGGAFMIPYIVALLSAGIPILFLDYAIGHRMRGSAPLAFARIKQKFEAFGWFQVAICFFITLYYAVIVAWSLSFFIFSFNTAWGNDTKEFLYNNFLHLADSPGVSFTPVLSVFLPLIAIWGAAIVVIALGVAKGVEKANKIFIPLLTIAFAVLVIRSLFLPGALDGLNVLFTPDFSKILDAEVWVAAYSQIFYSLSIAFGIMVTYASYRRRKSNQTSAGLVVAFANSSFELAAGIGVFAVIGFMAHEENVAVGDVQGLKGITLAFVTFPKAISQMPGANIFGALFFGSLTVAGFTSVLSLLQVVSSALQDKFNISPKLSAVVVGSISAVISCFIFGATTGLYTLDVLDHFACDIGTLFCGIMTCVLALWFGRKGKEFAYHLSSLSTFKVGHIWRLLVTIVNPTILIYIFCTQIYQMVTVGYGGGDYDFTYQFAFGWMALILAAVFGFVMYFTKWKHHEVQNFVAWPAFPPTHVGSTTKHQLHLDRKIEVNGD
jgi:NSS family neurotransmitter:Na+ symporter